MAKLIDGKLSSEPIAKVSETGEFERPESGFRGHMLRTDAEPGRFHLYVSYACPWAHRTIITRNLKKLEKIIDMSVSEPYMGEKGWTFSGPKDPKYLAVLYVAADKQYTGKVSVPVLWDKKRKTILNNESSEIIRIMNSSFDDYTESDIDLYPESLRQKIDNINEKVYNNVNNGVYKAGFAGTQASYNKAFERLFTTLDQLENLLRKQKFLTGDYFTEADLRLFTTLLRFDVVYFTHFKCNKKMIKDYPALFNFLKAIYQLPEVKPTCHFDHIKEHYYTSHPWLNPKRIIAKGPDIDLDSPHDRGEIRFYRKGH